MKLLELCEPLFQYVCRINRSARKGGNPNMSVVREEVRQLLAEMYQKSLSTPGLREQFEKVRLPLIYFVDYMMRSSKLGEKAGWRSLAEEENPPIYTGDESFFDPELIQTLAERGEAADERLAVFYTCMGLGFYGYYEHKPQEVRNYMKEIAGRIKHMMDPEDGRKICPEAYEYTNTADLTEPPLRPLTPIVVALVGLIVVLFASNAYLYWSGSKKLSEHVQKVTETAEKAVAAQQSEAKEIVMSHSPAARPPATGPAR